MASYTELLKRPEWQKKRLEILNRDEFTCQSCFDKQSQLHVHHKKYIFNLKPWEYNNDDYLTLCSGCHEYVTDIKKQTKLVIDNYFNDYNSLYELHNLISELIYFNPDELNDIKELIINYKRKI